MITFKFFKSKFFWGLILFGIVFFVYAFSIKDLWFSMDDLGNIINGLIKNFNDFIRIFSEDERNYIYPINFNVPHANIVSGFYRPMQHIPFSIIYFLKGLDAYSFYLCNLFFHALNSALFFYFCSFFMITKIAFLGGLLFAFYPQYDWIIWISTLHNFLAVFFMILSLFFFRNFLLNKNKSGYFFSALMFLFSILSRENTIFLGFWIFVAVYLLATDSEQSFWVKIKYSFSKTYLFLLSYFIYFLLRINAFGYKSLPRTFEHLYMRFTFLKKFFGSSVLEQTSNVVSSVVTQVVDKKAEVFESNKVLFLDLIFERLKNWFWFVRVHLANFFYFHDESNFGVFLLILLAIFFAVFLIYSYRKNIKILIALILGVILFLWPSFVAYPNPRYINAVYPFLIFTVLLGLNFFKQYDLKTTFNKVVLAVIFFLLGLAVVGGVRKNIAGLKSGSASSLVYKNKFANFFAENHFEPNVNFIVIGSPFVSDIQNVFQAFLNNIKLRLAHERASTLAERGSMGCGGDYKIKGVWSKIETLRIDGRFGFRLISLDKDHCAWWMNFSFFPLKWSKEDKAYVWAPINPEVGVWNDSSMGKFLINERLEDKYITDVIFIFDDEWINENTVFVTWDTVDGKYKSLGKAFDLFKEIK